ncbi:MAG: histidinol phosphate phosphatase domain-containing protein [Chloroflexota bacterium]|nr:histidinol phosphate phosphatase domain-containing protein [Chloroflexota bacterium]
MDFHTHSFFSDGALLPSELLRRVSALGYEAVAITDHADASNISFVLDRVMQVQRQQSEDFSTELILGVELTHVAPQSIDRLARQAKDCGAEIVVVHGETIVEPVAPGTNEAAVASPAVDILAHPGFLTLEEAQAAAAHGCFIEITMRRGHCLTNGHVARVCRQGGAKMLVNSDAHEPGDLATAAFAMQVARGAGLEEEEILSTLETNPRFLLSRIRAERAQ